MTWDSLKWCLQVLRQPESWNEPVILYHESWYKATNAQNGSILWRLHGSASALVNRLCDPVSQYRPRF